MWVLGKGGGEGFGLALLGGLWGFGMEVEMAGRGFMLCGIPVKAKAVVHQCSPSRALKLLS